MASPQDHVSMALFCDFENVALGVRDAKYDKFDIKRVLERLLLKGSIVVKKAYCDWERYKGFKATMHEANFELIEIPHVRQSGKNSADIRLVVDALDLCYTKAHVNTFVIISGDSDFSPLVSKLRENAKQVIGVGVKQSTSDLLIANCDEFIFYDDLVREAPATAAKSETREAQPAARRTPEEEKRRKEQLEARKNQAIEFAVETFEALLAERGDSGKIWASVLKEAIKRRKPGFNETYYGFRAFGNLLEEAQARGLLEFGRDEKSGAYVYRGNATTLPAADTAAEAAPVQVRAAAPAEPAPVAETAESAQQERPTARRPRQGEARSAKKSAKLAAAPQQAADADTQAVVEPAQAAPAGRRRKAGRPAPQQANSAPVEHAEPALPAAETVAAAEPAPAVETPPASTAKSGNRRRGSARKNAAAPAAEAPTAAEPASDTAAAPAAARKTASRGRRARKPESPPDAA